MSPSKSIPARSLLVLGGMLLAACSSPPRGPATDPARQAPATAETEGQTAGRNEDSNYGVRDEGPFPPPADVRFEEDILDPPEESGGESFGEGRVEQENLPDADETEMETEPLPATVETPVAPSVSPGQKPVDPNAPPSYQVVRGFRVQLIASSSHADASQLAREAESRLGVSVHVQTEGALYKVRAGDFVDRAEALQLRARAQANGYPEAWVVSTEIHVPRG